MKTLLSSLSSKGVSVLVADILDTLSRRSRSKATKAPEIDLIRTAEALLSRRGEASGMMLARLILEGYAEASPEERLAFLKALSEGFGPDEAALEAAVRAYGEDKTPTTINRLSIAVEPRRRELLRRINLAPGATHALVHMREDTLAALKANPSLRALDDDFSQLFSSWFNRGFLTLRPIDWTSPANILDKIIRYEAVHVIEGWDDLRNRLVPTDRRCFSFFHPRLPDEPLIFVEVALTTAIPDAISPLLVFDRDPIEAEEATTAVFYSISNTQKGLAGVSFGNFLIKQVVEDLSHALPNLTTFVTLSPAPGFAAWLAKERADEASTLLAERDRQALAVLDEPGWEADPAKREQVREPLLAAAAKYYLAAKLPNGRLPDPVGRFHLGNGARLERLNFLGDLSPRGLKQSHGLMVNYLYDLAHIEENHEEFAERGKVVASDAVRKWLRAVPVAKSRVGVA